MLLKLLFSVSLFSIAIMYVNAILSNLVHSTKRTKRHLIGHSMTSTELVKLRRIFDHSDGVSSESENTFSFKSDQVHRYQTKCAIIKPETEIETEAETEIEKQYSSACKKCPPGSIPTVIYEKGGKRKTLTRTKINDYSQPMGSSICLVREGKGYLATMELIYRNGSTYSKSMLLSENLNSGFKILSTKIQ